MTAIMLCTNGSCTIAHLAQSVCLHTGTPEAQGKADYVSSLVAEINHRKGFTAGLSQVLARAAGSLSKRRTALHQVSKRRTAPHQVSAKHLQSASWVRAECMLFCSDRRPGSLHALPIDFYTAMLRSWSFAAYIPSEEVLLHNEWSSLLQHGHSG